MARRDNPFDIDFSPFKVDVKTPTFDELYGINPRTKTKNKSKLTQTQKNKIKNLVGQCEMPGCKNHPHEVHHIKFLENGGTDSYSNLIVLCGSCHNDAHGKNPAGKKIPQEKLKNIVTKRSKIKAAGIKEILKGVGKKSKAQNDDSWDFRKLA